MCISCCFISFQAIKDAIFYKLIASRSQLLYEKIKYVGKKKKSQMLGAVKICLKSVQWLPYTAAALYLLWSFVTLFPRPFQTMMLYFFFQMTVAICHPDNQIKFLFLININTYKYEGKSHFLSQILQMFLDYFFRLKLHNMI